MNREGVMIIMYDLPLENGENRREYTRFRKCLKQMAYHQLQESVYIKHMRNLGNYDNELFRIDTKAPEDGSVIAFSMTMAQYRDIRVLRGEGLAFDSKMKPIIEL